MKMKTLAMLAGVSAPLIATATAPAGFLGIKVVGKPNEFGLLVCNIYAMFDRPPTPDPDNPGEFIFHDLMQAVSGTVNAPLLIQVEGGGTFYNHFLGGDQAPLTTLVGAFPIAAFDTFVTIGVKQRIAPGGPGPGQTEDLLTLTPGFGPIEGTQFATTTGGWAIIPDAAQADPFNPDFFAGDGRVLIGQFSTADGTAIRGTMLLQFVSNGVVGQSVVSFFHVPGPGALWLLGAAGLLGSRRRRCSGHAPGPSTEHVTVASLALSVTATDRSGDCASTGTFWFGLG